MPLLCLSINLYILSCVYIMPWAHSFLLSNWHLSYFLCKWQAREKCGYTWSSFLACFSHVLHSIYITTEMCGLFTFFKHKSIWVRTLLQMHVRSREESVLNVLQSLQVLEEKEYNLEMNFLITMENPLTFSVHVVHNKTCLYYGNRWMVLPKT